MMQKLFVFAEVDTQVDPLFGLRVAPTSPPFTKLSAPEPDQPRLEELQVGEYQIRRSLTTAHRYKVTRVL